MGDSLKKYVLLSEKSWHDCLYQALVDSLPGEWIRIKRKEDFTEEFVLQIEPNVIFIPHWSYIIPAEIFNKFECIVFHMTDLPYGRGGSPLQNLIVRGHKDTKISALKVVENLEV